MHIAHFVDSFHQIRDLFHCFPHIDILWILAEHKQGYWTEPDGAGEGGKIGDLVGAAAGEGGLELGEQGIAGEVALGGGGDDFHARHSIIIGEDGAEAIGTRYHHQVVVVEGPAWIVDVPAAVFLVVELQFILLSLAEHAGCQLAGSIDEVIDCIHLHRA